MLKWTSNVICCLHLDASNNYSQQLLTKALGIVQVQANTPEVFTLGLVQTSVKPMEISHWCRWGLDQDRGFSSLGSDLTLAVLPLKSMRLFPGIIELTVRKILMIFNPHFPCLHITPLFLVMSHYLLLFFFFKNPILTSLCRQNSYWLRLRKQRLTVIFTVRRLL